MKLYTYNVYDYRSYTYDYIKYYYIIKIHYRVPLSYDLTTFQILGQKFVKFFGCILVQKDILVQTMTPKGHFEIN